jgi:hypothetical protein
MSLHSLISSSTLLSSVLKLLLLMANGHAGCVAGNYKTRVLVGQLVIARLKFPQNCATARTRELNQSVPGVIIRCLNSGDICNQTT